jgi:glyceraldehyde 3-phosphate dehydrogenase
MTGILLYSEAPIVSSDIVKSPYSSIYDAPLTSVMNETQVKVVAWYDNEWGYSVRTADVTNLIASKL